MISKRKPVIIILIISVFVLLIVYYFIFNIYDIKIKSSHEKVFSDSSIKVKLTLTPINALGWEIPFRNVSGKFKIMDGGNIIVVIQTDEKNGFIIFSPTGSEGIIEFKVETKYSVFPLYYKINILSKSV